MRKPFLFLFLLGIILASLYGQPVLAQPKVEVIKEYKMEAEIHDNDVRVRIEVTLQNLIDKPLVPGVGEIRLQKMVPKRVLIFTLPSFETPAPVEVDDVNAETADGKEIKTKVINGENYTTIQYEIWYPIKPKGTFTFTIEYTMKDVIAPGILFREASIPVGADIDIKNLTIHVSSTDHITYRSIPGGELPAEYLVFAEVETSKLPLPEMGFKWSNVFWVIVLVLIGIGIIVRARGKG